ncbi:hypothetical protein [Pendulispora albinea]
MSAAATLGAGHPFKSSRLQIAAAFAKEANGATYNTPTSFAA